MNTKVSVIIPAYNQEQLVIRALDSVPDREDVEILVISDGSTDDTYGQIIRYKNQHPNKHLFIMRNLKNRGVGFTVNKGLDRAHGEYVVLLGSDDYFLTGNFNRVMTRLNGTDIVYFDLEVNDGSIWHLCESTKEKLCGSVKFIRREFLGDTRNPELRAREDYFLFQELLKKNPTEDFTGIVAKHYNFPRKGSLIWLDNQKSKKGDK